MQRFQHILVDAGTDQPETAVTRAAQLALENKASLTLMDVVKPIPKSLGMMTDVAKPEELEKLVAADRRRRLLDLAYTIAQRDSAKLHVVAAWQLWMEDSMRRHAGDDAVDFIRKDHEARVHKRLDELLQTPFADANDIQLHLRQGSPASVIQSVADEIEADLIVMGTVCRTGLAGFLIGNTAETLIPDVTCSLLALKPDGFRSPVQMTDSVLTEEDEPLPLM